MKINNIISLIKVNRQFKLKQGVKVLQGEVSIVKSTLLNKKADKKQTFETLIRNKVDDDLAQKLHYIKEFGLYRNLTVKDLKEIAHNYGIKIFKEYTKPDIIRKIKNAKFEGRTFIKLYEKYSKTYYCGFCRIDHRVNSIIGKRHIKYRSYTMR